MKSFVSRRRRNLILLAVLSTSVVMAYAVVMVSLYPVALFTGWFLAALMVVLASYNAFKKVPFLPLGASATWLQFHLYLGFLSILVFFLHAGVHMPRSMLGWILTLLYFGAAGTGVVGLLMSRMYPKHLRARGEEVIFEQIPVLRRRLHDQADQLVIDAAAQLGSTYVTAFYSKRLKWFFDGPRHFWRHVFRFSGYRQALLTEIDAQSRYLNDKERDVMKALTELVKRKDDLDFHYALQAMLKRWLFVHIPVAYSLIVFAAFHILVVYAYSGVIR